MNKKYDVIGIGNALLDITLDVEEETLKELGLRKGEMTLIDEERLESITEKIADFETRKSSGGSAANTMVGVSKLGGSSAFIGKVGKDANGKLYDKMLSADGVKTFISKEELVKTGTAITFITSDGERSFATYLGAAIKLTPDDVKDDEIKKAKILHIEGYVLEEPTLRSAALKAMGIAKDEKILVSIDLADPWLIKRNLELFKGIVKDYADMVFANEEEAEAFTGLRGEEAIKKMKDDARICAIKLGEKGSLLKAGVNLCYVPIVKVTSINTNGAGDAYAAGVLYSIARNLPLEKAGKIAAYIAAQVVASPEATVRRSLKGEIRHLLEK